MLKTIKEEYYILSDGLSLHYWGYESIVTDDIGMKYKLNEIQTDVIEFCNGMTRGQEIINAILDMYQCPVKYYDTAKNKIIECLEGLIRNRLIEVTKENKERLITGVKGKFYPTELSIEITNICNFKCKHCYKNAEFKGKHIEPEIISIINKKFAKKTKNIQLTGGEPFVNPNLIEYIELLSKNFNISVVSNGSMLIDYPDSVLNKIDNIQFSIYGASANEYLHFTENKNGWDGLCNSIRKVNSLNINNHLSLTLSKDNLDKMDNYVEAAVSIGAKKIRFGIPSVVGRALEKDNRELFHFNKLDIKRAYQSQRELKRKYLGYIDVEIWGHVGDWNVNNVLTNSDNTGILSCGAGYMSYVISQNGNIRPCEFLPEDLFDICSIRNVDDIINGDFKNEELLDGICKFECILNQHDKSSDCVCQSIKEVKKFNI